MWCSHIKLQHNAEAVRGHGHQTGGHHQANIHTHILNSIFEGFVSEQENSEIDGLNRSYEEPAAEQELSQTDGPNNTFEGAASDQETSENEDDKHLKHKGILSDFEEEAMLFMTMQEKKNKKLKKRARQRIRAQVI